MDSEKIKRVEADTNPPTESRDEIYAKRFWARVTIGKRPAFLEDKRRAMREVINDAITKQNGRLSTFVTRSPEGRFDEEDRENISALRECAKEMGYVLGPMTHNGGDETASGFLTKIEP